MMRMRMNRHNSIDEYNNHLRKIRIIYQFSLVIAMIISLPLAAIRIYMLNGFGKQWEYVIAAESRISIAEKSRFSRSGLSYEYEHNGTTYHGFQPIGKSSIQTCQNIMCAIIHVIRYLITLIAIEKRKSSL